MRGPSKHSSTYCLRVILRGRKRGDSAVARRIDNRHNVVRLNRPVPSAPSPPDDGPGRLIPCHGHAPSAEAQLDMDRLAVSLPVVPAPPDSGTDELAEATWH